MDKPPRVVVTGATGFIGRNLLAALLAAGHRALPLNRETLTRLVDNPSGKIGEGDILIHCAARAHVLDEREPDPLAAFRRANRETTLALAQAAQRAGFRRFVFISSIGVLGQRTTGQPFRPGDVPAPTEDYAVSKHEAETALRAMGGGLEIVILRLPLVHGPHPKGNFARLLNAVAHGRPLPLGRADHNRRSFLGMSNLCEGILTLLDHPAAKDRTYHLADTGVISTRRLVEVLAEGMGVKPNLWPLPPRWVIGGARLLGKGAVAQRLFDDLEVDAGDLTRDTGWSPRVPLEDGLREMAAGWRSATPGGHFS